MMRYFNFWNNSENTGDVSKITIIFAPSKITSFPVKNCSCSVTILKFLPAHYRAEGKDFKIPYTILHGDKKEAKEEKQFKS